MSALRLRYNLNDLPSSQHRTGLAGLVAMLDWRNHHLGARKGVAELRNLDADGAEIEVDAEGLADLFDIIYEATEEDREVERPYKKKGKDVPWKATVEREVTSKKTGKTTTKTYYVYPEIVPKGAFLLERDTTREGNKGIWVKLWRDMIWQTLRGVPATRKPFEDRAMGKPSKDAARLWKTLVKPPNKDSLDLPSTYFLGAQSQTAEGVAFRDRARQMLLLHFWPFAAQIYVPQVTGDDGRRNFAGYAVVIPDILDLEGFSEEMTELLLGRGKEVAGYRPRDAVVDLPIESALEVMTRMRDRLAHRVGRRIEHLVLGFDVLHVEKEGNNIRVRSVDRLPPEGPLIDEYLKTRDYWSRPFRVQWLRNVVAHNSRWTGFDRLCATTKIEHTFDDYAFRHDARIAFRGVEEMRMENKEPESPREADERLEALVLQVARTYVARKVERKHNVRWDTPGKRKEYAKAAEDVARSAFLAVRSRTQLDFIEYFTATLCSVPQFLPPRLFEQLSKAVLEDSARVRTLTLMALSAAGYASTKTKETEE